MIPLIRFCLVGCAVFAACGALLAEEVPGMIVKDFVHDYATAKVTNSISSSSSERECSGKVEIPGIFLHPVASGDAVLAYSGVLIPAPKNNYKLFLVFRIGFRDDIPWKGGEVTPNGCRFSVHVGGNQVFSEDYAGAGWQDRAVPLEPSTKLVTVEFHVNAIDGLTNYDWALWGAPMVVAMPPEPDKRLGAGVTLVEVSASEPTQAKVVLGDLSVDRKVATGSNWFAFFARPRFARPALEADPAKATLKSWTDRAFPAQVVRTDEGFSSPLLIQGEPFSYFITVRNQGLGDQTEPFAVKLGDSQDGLRVPGACDTPCNSLPVGQTHTLWWKTLLADKPGVYKLERQTPRMYVFPPSPQTSPDHPDKAYASVTRDAPVEAVVGNAWSRLSFVVDALGGAYAIAETWNGKAWQRTGSIYPLASVRADFRTYTAETWYPPEMLFPSLPLMVSNIEAKGASLVITGRFGTLDFTGSDSLDMDSASGTVTFTADAASPRIQMKADCTFETYPFVYSFYGPNVLAGDRAYGVKKDFAIFPGLEYLEGDEPSSSERDLAYPLSDRRVPAAHKIATPLMAVQAQDTLMALLWDARQEWVPGQRTPAARFSAPSTGGPQQQITMAVFAPSVGPNLYENTYSAMPVPFVKPPIPLTLRKRDTLSLSSVLVLDHKSRYGEGSVVNGPHRGGLVLMAMQHWFDVYGLPEPSPQPRDWGQERALCRDAYLRAVWDDKAGGWAHCAKWKACGAVAPIVSLTLDMASGMPGADRDAVRQRIERVTADTLKRQGKHYFWSNAGAHILLGELPFYMGYVGESMADFRTHAQGLLGQRKDGLWTWNPATEQQATLGKAGDHTLSQASQPSYVALRAARLSGDPDLAAKALDAMKQMDRYEVPRGAQTWECPLYQPDILASAQAIRAYCEAYRLTGNPKYLEHARYWAWTGLPFLYMWELDGYPTMRYNAISVFGSTFYKHSWLGLPVVWCGLVYAYALQDLAEFDQSFDWKRIAQGVTNSAMAQQYPDGDSKGCYPDSWNMIKNSPNPADINPENILVNEFRLRGQSPEIRCARLKRDGQCVMLNTSANIVEATLEGPKGHVVLALPTGFVPYATLAPVPEPSAVSGAAERATDSDALRSSPAGWLYDAGLKAIIIKCGTEAAKLGEKKSYEIAW